MPFPSAFVAATSAPMRRQPCVAKCAEGGHAAKVTPEFTLARPSFRAGQRAHIDAPMWRFVLLSDGHLAQHLEIISRRPVTERELGVQHHARGRLGCTLCRQTTLRVAHRDAVYVCAWWDPRVYRSLMDVHGRLFWQRCRDLRWECSREMLAVHFGVCEPLVHVLDLPHARTKLWARDYVFRKEGVAFLVVHEVFSPTLETVLGPMPQFGTLSDR